MYVLMVADKIEGSLQMWKKPAVSGGSNSGVMKEANAVQHEI
jgi:hypothetical protein